MSRQRRAAGVSGTGAPRRADAPARCVRQREEPERYSCTLPVNAIVT